MEGEGSPTIFRIFLFLPLTPPCVASPAPAHLTPLWSQHTAPPSLPCSVPLLGLGPLPGEPSPNPNPNPTHPNQHALGKAQSDPCTGAHCFLPLCSHHQAELLRHDHRPLCTIIICFRSCLAHQVEARISDPLSHAFLKSHSICDPTPGDGDTRYPRPRPC